MHIETMIYVYLAVCVCMILFNIACIFAFQRKEQNITHRSRYFKESLNSQFDLIISGNHVTQQHQKYLSKKLKKIPYLLAFDETLAELQKEQPEKLRQYLNEITPVFVSLASVYEKKSELKIACFSYLIQKYGVIRNKHIVPVNAMLMGLINHPNLYCRENALKALYTTGDVSLIMEALQILDNSNLYHSPKLLTDGLLSFAGSHENLCACIWDNFDEYSLNMKITLLNYMRFQSGSHCEKMLALLKNEEENEEIRFACIRYFGKYPDTDAYPLLLDFAEHEKERSWQYAAIAATSLASYPGEKTVAVLKQKLSSRNWYVRLNASKSLEHLGLSYIDLLDIFEGGDRYAREILNYRFDMRIAREKEGTLP